MVAKWHLLPSFQTNLILLILCYIYVSFRVHEMAFEKRNVVQIYFLIDLLELIKL